MSFLPNVWYYLLFCLASPSTCLFLSKLLLSKIDIFCRKLNPHFHGFLRKVLPAKMFFIWCFNYNYVNMIILRLSSYIGQNLKKICFYSTWLMGTWRFFSSWFWYIANFCINIFLCNDIHFLYIQTYSFSQWI